MRDLREGFEHLMPAKEPTEVPEQRQAEKQAKEQEQAEAVLFGASDASIDVTDLRNRPSQNLLALVSSIESRNSFRPRKASFVV